VLTTIEFDNQMPRDAAEICEVGTDPMLATEFEPRETLAPELCP
jgi:hypothetical protein